MKIIKLLSLSLFLLVAITALTFAAELQAGTARVEITPPVGFPMGGYGARQGFSTGIHDPLFATVLLLKADGVSVTIVSCDLLSFPSERILTLARERKLADYVLIAATHNHSGPVTWRDKSWPSPDRSWYAEAETKILNAIEEASKKMFTARIAAGFGEIYLGHNRRKVAADGKVTMFWRNAERLPTSPVDPTFGVIRVDDETGKPRAVLVNYACHAVVLGPDNRQISADYPGFLRKRVEQAMPGALCLFAQGGAGDINPYQDKQPVAENGFGEAEKTGNALAEEVLKVANKLKPAANSSAKLQAISEVKEFRDRWDTTKTVKAGLTTLLLNNNIAIATIPGEPFVDLQIALRDKSEVTNTFLFGYTFSAGGEWIGYVPTIRAASEGGYGANSSTNIEVGAGEAMVDHHVVNLFTLMGKLKKSPSF